MFAKGDRLRALVVLLFLILAPQVQASHLIEIAYGEAIEIFPQDALVTRTWDGEGSTNNWSEAANWSGDTLPNDHAIFDGTSTKNVTIDIGVDMSSITITSAYTGIVTVASGINITLGQTSSQAGGTFNAGSGTINFGNMSTGGGLNLSGGTFNAGSGPLNFLNVFTQTGGTFNGGSGNASGEFQLNGGTFNAPSGVMTITFDLRINGATFSHNGGTVTFVGGNSTFNVLPSEVTLNNLTINKNELGRVNIPEASRTVRVTGTLTLTEGGIEASSGATIKSEGAIDVATTFGNTGGSAGSATLLIQDGVGPRTINLPAGAALFHVRLNDTNATIAAVGVGTARLGVLTLQNGSVDTGSTNVEIGLGAGGVGYSQSGGSFTSGAGNVSLVTGNFQLSGGTFSMTSGSATFPCFLQMAISGGTFNASSGLTTICPGGDINGSFIQSAGIFNGGSGTLDINHSFSLTGGTFNATSGTTQFGFTFDHQGGAFNHNGGTVVFDSVHGSPSINAPGSPGTDTFNNFTLSKNGDLGVQGSDKFIINGTLHLVNGTLSNGEFQPMQNMIVDSTADGGNSRITFGGAGTQTYTNIGGPNTTGVWTVDKSGGILTAATSLILGTSQPLNITSGTLNLGNGSNLTVGALNIAAGATLANDSATTITLGANPVNNGSLILNGSGPSCPGDDSILLRSSVDGQRRNWSGTGTFNLTDVDVKDMGGNTAPPAPPAITVYNGTNTGNNGSNWTFSTVCSAANRLGFVVHPSNSMAGQAIAPSIQVAIQDTVGNTIPGATNAVTLAIANNPGSGTLLGTVTRNAVDGVATFNDLSIQRAANGYTLQAISTGLASATSNGFNITAGAPAQLAFLVQPANAIMNTPITPPMQVAVHDAFGNIVTTAQFSMGLFLENNPSAAVLSGTPFQPLVNGVATFPNMSLNRVGTGYTIRANWMGLNVISNAFNITRPIFTVTNRNNTGAGSLRQAIMDANALPGADTIAFNIPVPAPFRISPTTPLPDITEPVLIDGTTQPGYSGTPIVELNGSFLQPNPFPPPGLNIRGGNSTIRGLVVNGFASGVAIRIGDNGGNVVRGNYIGTNAAGTASLSNKIGISVESPNNAIGGTTTASRNVISGNTTAGLTLSSSTIVKGNFIGTDATGTTGIGNGTGIELTGLGTQVGGTESGAGNVIAFNNQSGIRQAYPLSGPIIGNSIFSNGGLGLDSMAIGVTENDPGDFASNGPNFPVIDFAISTSGFTTIRATLSARANINVNVDFYTSPVCDPSGYGEGQTYLASMTANSGPSGVASIIWSDAIPTTVGHYLTAVTRQGSSMSEFSQCRTIGPSAVSISGRVMDNNNMPLANTVLQVTGGPLSTRVTTNRSGDYSVISLPGGVTYTVTPSKPNHDFTPPSRTYANVLSNQTGQNYTAVKARYGISGQLARQVGGLSTPLYDVTLTLSGTVARTMVAGGSYAFNDLPPGNYTVTASKDGYVFSPPSANVVITNVDVEQSFSGTASSPLPGRLVFSVSGRIGSMNADGSAYAPYLSSTIADANAISKNGRRIAYRRTSPTPGLFVADADGTNEVMVSAGRIGIRPSWSPDGTRLAFIKVSSAGTFVTIVNADGTNEIQIPTGSLHGRSDPNWISSNRLVFLSSLAGETEPEVFAINVDGTNLLRLTNLPSYIHALTASPDGTRVAFVAAPNLFVMNSDGTGLLQIRSDASSGRPMWSPDGSLIAYFQSGPGSRPAVVNANNGGNLRVLHNQYLPFATWGLEYDFPTLTGNNQTVTAGGASVTFTNVAVGGTTTFTPLSPTSVGTPPTGYVLGDRAYDISTTAAFVAPVSVCFKVAPTTAPTQAAFDALALLHSEGGMLVDRTASRNFATRTICASSFSLSPFVLAAQANAPSPSNGLELPSISGLVVDNTGNPLPDVAVELTGTETRTVQTDAFGNFHFVNLTDSGNYNVQPQLPGYLFTERSMTFVNLNGENSAMFTGFPGTYSVSGRVVDPSGVGIADAVVNLDGARSDSAVTDANGDYVFPNLPADGAYTVTPTGLGVFNPPNAVLSALAGNVTGVNFTQYQNAPEFASIVGRTVTADGDAISRVFVSVVNSEGQIIQTAISSPFGYYLLSNVQTGQTYTLLVGRKGYEFSGSTIEIFVTGDINGLDFIALP